ncbi:MAG: hypothetical protein RL607_1608 [Bacteroidota bacterium]
MSKTFNFYCDESCHLERGDEKYMLISYVSCAYNQVKIHNDFIRQIKRKHFLKGEIKWTSLSKSQYPLYSEIVDYFFATDLQFRAIIIDKSTIKNQEFEQNHDDFYYKMYYQLLNKKIQQQYKYNIYIDVKDTHSGETAKKLKSYLNRQYLNVNNLQPIQSYESELMQIADVLMGALSYHLRGLNQVIAKNKLIEKISKHSNVPLNSTSPLFQEKFNLFFIDLK